MRPKAHRQSFILGCGIITLLISGSVYANDAEAFRNQIQKHTQRHVELQKADTKKVATSTLGEFETQLKQANLLLAEEEWDDLEWLVRKIEAQSDIVDAQVDLNDVKVRADAREKTLDELRKRHSELLEKKESLRRKLLLLGAPAPAAP